MKFLRMHYKDTSTSDTRAWFTKYGFDGGIEDEYEVVSTGNAGPGTSDTAAIDETIDTTRTATT